MQLTVFVAEYPGFARAANIADTLPDASREKLRRKLDRADVFLGELLRLRISSELGEDAAALKKSEYGKPYFEGRDDAAFNISHSGRLAVGALLRRGADFGVEICVGVDTERIDRENVGRMDKISTRFFTESERALIARSDDAAAEFYMTWTRKEAYLKYTGEGITRPLGEVDTTSLRGVDLICRRLTDGEGNEYAFSVCVPFGIRGENINFIKIL